MRKQFQKTPLITSPETIARLEARNILTGMVAFFLLTLATLHLDTSFLPHFSLKTIQAASEIKSKSSPKQHISPTPFPIKSIFEETEYSFNSSSFLIS